MFNTITVPLGRQSKGNPPVYGTISVDTTRFPPEVQRHIYEYGLRQSLNDAMATKKDKDGERLSRDEIIAKAHKRLANLYAGNLRAVASENESLDPKTMIVHNLLREALLAKWRADGVFGTFPKGTKNRFLFCANKSRAARGLPECETDAEYLEAVLAANARTRARFERRADEILAEREEDLGIEI